MFILKKKNVEEVDVEKRLEWQQVSAKFVANRISITLNWYMICYTREVSIVYQPNDRPTDQPTDILAHLRLKVCNQECVIKPDCEFNFPFYLRCLFIFLSSQFESCWVILPSRWDSHRNGILENTASVRCVCVQKAENLHESHTVSFTNYPMNLQ